MAIGVFLLSGCAPPPEEIVSTPLTAKQTISQRYIDIGDYEGAIDSAISLYNLSIDPNKVRIGAPSNSFARTETTDQGEIILTNGAISNGAIDLVSMLAHESVHIDQLYNSRWYDDDTIGRPLNEVEAYDWVNSHANEVELSPSVIDGNQKERDNNYIKLPTNVQNNINNGICTIDLPVLPTPSTSSGFRLIPI